ncbi:M15 family metallopeptidase [Kibdelosporangium philippinense]|uniref:M15 family metallopeptidase n=1 Tax=Kibdelosporangium philippinense TaxID=211113 RepID=A0ABS8ZG36_9PSEU|nr:M15 family metallopeptidase [Kibdelosporangium philippinense]MCE7005875.1 M15 family metallopeptidase [Kibdelosporangium philippinense]
MKLAIVALALVLSACTTLVTPKLASSQDDAALADSSVSPFDNDHPAISRLDPKLRDAMQQAARDAEAKGIKVVVTSGWRSRDYQQQLLDEATSKYGSLADARKHVNTPDKFTHVTGKAVDIGYTDAADWFSRKGSKYGLCQTYSNEMWHYELATEPGGECPPQLANAAG